MSFLGSALLPVILDRESWALCSLTGSPPAAQAYCTSSPAQAFKLQGRQAWPRPAFCRDCKAPTSTRSPDIGLGEALQSLCLLQGRTICCSLSNLSHTNSTLLSCDLGAYLLNANPHSKETSSLTCFLNALELYLLLYFFPLLL